MITEEIVSGEKNASLPSSLTEMDLIHRLLPDELELTPDQEVTAALDYLDEDQTGSVHLTTPITDCLVKGNFDDCMARIVLAHLRACGWCRDMLRDTLHLSDVSADHPACALLSQTDPWFAEAQDGLASLRDISENWDSDGAETPNETALANTRRVLDILQRLNFRPDRIAPSAEGGVMLSFYVGKRYGDIEMFNTGEILAVTSDGGGSPHDWEVTEDEVAIADALETIRDYITIRPEQQIPGVEGRHETCLGETQILTLPEHEYDAVQTLIGNKREPNGEVKKAIERLRNRTW